MRPVLKILRSLRKRWRNLLTRMPQVLKVSYRVTVTKVGIRRPKYIKKKFTDTELGRACYEHEMLASKLFKTLSWSPSIIDQGPLIFTRQFFPEKNRLDQIAPHLRETTRRQIAREIISVLFDIFSAGYAHRDIQSANFYWINGKIILTDFEWLEAYPPGRRPAFPECYDITGKGLESPGHTNNMCYCSEHPLSIQNILGIPIECALNEFKKKLKERLRSACKTFATVNTRHVCSARRIYSSFELPYFSVGADEAQRDSQKRLRDFGVDKDTLSGKTVLDLGSNIGGILFQIQRYEPGLCVGVEYDSDKVEIASHIAAYNGLENITFLRADVDTLSADTLNGPFDVAFCLALEAHVKDPLKLFRLLSNVAGRILYFEGNSNSDIHTIQQELTNAGFTDVVHLGFGTDDCIPNNNRRPMFRATK